MKMPCALTIAGYDSGGGAGIQADLKSFSALGVHGLCVVTAVTAQNTKGIEGIMEVPPEFVSKQLNAVVDDFEVEWAKTGMLSNLKIILAVKKGVKRHGLRLVVDPLMTTATGTPLLRGDAIEALKDLMRLAELVTPNVHEAEKLSDMKIRSMDDMRRAARAISRLGPRAVLIKGGHLEGKTATDVLYTEGRFKEFKTQRIAGVPVHGAGCSFSAAITAELAKKATLQEGIATAKKFITESIKNKIEVGKGLRPVNQMATLLLNAEKARCFEEVWQAAKMVTERTEFVKLLPEFGTNIVMALPGARSSSEVVGLSGRIVKSGGRAFLTGFPELGGSKHVANVVLTAMSHDPKIRACMNVKFSPHILNACRKLGLTISRFDRGEEPKGVKTMRWGTEQSIRKIGKVPQIIFDRGAPGKEPMIRILGTAPTEVIKTALCLAEKLK